jgi:IgA Peptidase M64
MSVKRLTGAGWLLPWFLGLGAVWLATGCGRDSDQGPAQEPASTPGDAVEDAGRTPAVSDGGTRDAQSSRRDAGQDARVATEPTAADAAVGPADAALAEQPYELDCGPNGVAIESAGPPKNRVNYVILGDGYAEAQLDTLFVQHIQKAMTKRFSPIGEPYGRYRKFVNICAFKVASQTSPIGKGATAFKCTGDDQSRLANCDERAAEMAIAANVPAGMEVDWKALVLNNDRWWNTGAQLMLWSGAHKDAAGAALHEGGHGFHQLADEYAGTGSGCTREYDEVNSTVDMSKTAGKWELWLDYVQPTATGRQGVFLGSRYCDQSQYRPSQNSMMNSLFGDNPNTSFNSVSREKMVMDVWRVVTPIDEVTPPAGALASPTLLTVRVIDPAVIDVDWSVDGQVAAAKGGARFEVAGRGLSPGTHTITARAYDNAGPELVRATTGTKFGRMNWARSQQTVSWTVTVP